MLDGFLNVPESVLGCKGTGTYAIFHDIKLAPQAIQQLAFAHAWPPKDHHTAIDSALCRKILLQNEVATLRLTLQEKPKCFDPLRSTPDLMNETFEGLVLVENGSITIKPNNVLVGFGAQLSLQQQHLAMTQDRDFKGPRAADS